MGKGRKALPDALKEGRGTLRKCRSRGELKGSPINVENMDFGQVEGLYNDRSRKIYEEVCKNQAALGYMERLYQPMMIIYAYWLDIIFICQEQIQLIGMVKTQYDDAGNFKAFIANPYFKISAIAFEIVNKIAQQFGMTPVSRGNLKQVEKEIDPVADLDRLAGSR